jgi:hypothetical protein
MALGSTSRSTLIVFQWADALWASSSRLAGGSSSHGSLRIQAGASTQPNSTQRRRFGRGTAGMMAGQRGWLLGSQPALRAM